MFRNVEDFERFLLLFLTRKCNLGKEIEIVMNVFDLKEKKCVLYLFWIF
jgi:hypothetical protein